MSSCLSIIFLNIFFLYIMSCHKTTNLPHTLRMIMFMYKWCLVISTVTLSHIVTFAYRSWSKDSDYICQGKRSTTDLLVQFFRSTFVFMYDWTEAATSLDLSFSSLPPFHSICTGYVPDNFEYSVKEGRDYTTLMEFSAWITLFKIVIMIRNTIREVH